jgi:hypothetical protein
MEPLRDFLREASSEVNLGLMRLEVDTDIKESKKLSSKHLKTLVEKHQESLCNKEQSGYTCMLTFITDRVVNALYLSLR